MKKFNLSYSDAFYYTQLGIEIENSITRKDYDKQLISDFKETLEGIVNSYKSVSFDILNMIFNAIPGRNNVERFWKNRSHKDNIQLQLNLAVKELGNFDYLSEQRKQNLTEFCFNLGSEICNYYSSFNKSF